MATSRVRLGRSGWFEWQGELNKGIEMGVMQQLVKSSVRGKTKFSGVYPPVIEYSILKFSMALFVTPWPWGY